MNKESVHHPHTPPNPHPQTSKPSQERGALEVQQTTWQLGGLCLALARLVLLVRTPLHHQRPLFLTLQHRSPSASRAVLPYHRKGDHTTRHNNTHKGTTTCDLLPACLMLQLLLVPTLPTACPGTTKPKQQVHLIPHLSSPLLEPPVKVGLQGVLVIQLTAIGTHALQAVGPQDWPMALYTIFCRTFGLLSHTANVQLPRHGPTSSLFSQAHSARSGRSQASLLPTMPI